MGTTKHNPEEWSGPKSLCDCGHTGDGCPGGEHGSDVLPNGHGACCVAGCGCQQFTWDGWTSAYARHLDASA